MFPKRTS